MYGGYTPEIGYTLLRLLAGCFGRRWLSSVLLMRYILAWGNNLTGNLDPTSSDSILSIPRHVLAELDVEELKWSSWASTIVRGRSALCMRRLLTTIVGDDYYSWGSAMPESPGQNAVRLSPTTEPLRFLGLDESTAYLDRDGYVHPLPDDGPKSSTAWRDVVMTGPGPIYTLSSDENSCKRVHCFQNMEQMMANIDPTPISHPLLGSICSLYATESRIFGLTSGPLTHVLEIDEKGSVKLVEDLEGLGIKSVVAGSGNRLGVITEAGDAYLINRRSMEPKLLEIEDESAVRFLGVGSRHEVVVTEENVWVRGESESSDMAEADEQTSSGSWVWT